MKRQSKGQTAELADLARLPDDQIDLSDAPELLDWSRAVVGKFYRPIKRPVTVGIDAMAASVASSSLPSRASGGPSLIKSANAFGSAAIAASRTLRNSPHEPGFLRSPDFRYFDVLAFARFLVFSAASVLLPLCPLC